MFQINTRSFMLACLAIFKLAASIVTFKLISMSCLVLKLSLYGNNYFHVHIVKQSRKTQKHRLSLKFKFKFYPFCIFFYSPHYQLNVQVLFI